MAIRPVFCPNLPSVDAAPGVKQIEVEFKWVPGQAHTQRQKCAASLQAAIRKQLPQMKALEISSKSDTTLGIALSALNLAGADGVAVETNYQCGKVFEGGVGPFAVSAFETPSEARKAVRERAVGRQLVAFSHQGTTWPLEPSSLFYDWLYCSTLAQNEALAKRVLQHNGFTDIEFNPEKSVSCQAAAAAYYASLHAFGLLDAALSSAKAFMETYTRQGKVLPQTKQAEFCFG